MLPGTVRFNYPLLNTKTFLCLTKQINSIARCLEHLSVCSFLMLKSSGLYLMTVNLESQAAEKWDLTPSSVTQGTSV